MKKVVVAGDLIWDFNLAQHPIKPAFHQEILPSTVLNLRAGGAWYLKDLVDLACADLGDTQIVGPKREGLDCMRPSARVGHAYQIWSLYDQARDREGDGQAWRISRFLGCQRAEVGTKVVLLEEDIRDPTLLVLDDLGLGFARQPDAWPAALRKGGSRGSILVKTSGGPVSSPLWDQLLEEPFASRLTVVLSAKTLRDRGVSISQALSWDRTIEEVVSEVEQGISSQDLALCRRVIIFFGCAGAASFRRFPVGGDAAAQGGRPPALEKRARFERFVYDPEDLEGAWQASRLGQTFGAASILAAAMVRHELDPQTYPLFIALGRGLVAQKVNHEMATGSAGHFDPDAAHEKVRDILNGTGKEEPAGVFCSAFRHEVLFDVRLKGQPASHSDLLQDLTGVGLEYVAAKAMEVVLRGPDRALWASPKACYGKYFTVDREEIERINAIRNLILSYQENRDDRRPLSLAVFGPAGSGKSFAIKQLAVELFGEGKAVVLEFNLSQFHGEEDLHTAFHQVRDASVQGRIPLVFWDEFDTGGLRWLQYFLAPMQDARFRAGAIEHPFGKAIFVFAGGTCDDFESFDRNPDDEVSPSTTFRQMKGPDFVSRLRGFVNIKGPNSLPSRPSEDGGSRVSSAAREIPLEQETACLIRRAIVLRVSLEKYYPQLVDPKTARASVSASVIGAFLRVREFLHGARSMDAVVSMSSVGQGRRYGAAELPTRELLSLHVTADFLDHVRAGELEVPLIEALAEACHMAWREQKEANGWKYAEKRCDERKEHSLLLPYRDLKEEDKERNRSSARVVRAKLLEVGYRIERWDADHPQAIDEEEFKVRRGKLIEIEHDIWLREHLLQGYERASTTNDRLRLHCDIAPLAALSSKEQQLDEAIINSIPKTLAAKGYTCVEIRK